MLHYKVPFILFSNEWGMIDSILFLYVGLSPYVLYTQSKLTIQEKITSCNDQYSPALTAIFIGDKCGPYWQR